MSKHEDRDAAWAAWATKAGIPSERDNVGAHNVARLDFEAGWHAARPNPPVAGEPEHCGLGICAAMEGHEGTCAEASGWAVEGEPEREALADAIHAAHFRKWCLLAKRCPEAGQIADYLIAAGYRREPEPREVTTECGQKGWLDEDQDDDNPCVCGLAARHEGLHACFEGCGGEWAGGTPSTEEGES